ncbi:hypothetical protein GH714_001011 [Hevea brasiliensis]|uniref:tRNA (guanine(10)-N(2))-methyltransferase n=1 Tax=Hevea brasiliensis TaxID=3981 RepID=A0A6A6M648_HEVBR|nr:hypothetical protein GH714_001011 [Hevea brasiliensis]
MVLNVVCLTNDNANSCLKILKYREQTVAALVSLGADTRVLADPSPEFPLGRTPADLASGNGHKGISGFLAESSLTSYLQLLTLSDSTEGGSPDISATTAVQTIAERMATPANESDVSNVLSLKDSLTAIRNATQAANRIHQVFRMQSFQRKQLTEYGDDEFNIFDGRALALIAANTHKPIHSDGLDAAAMQIQKKFRGWKKRKEFLIIRQRIVKIQAHVRGHQVRKRYRTIIWSVGILEKVILRWRRKGSGLRGFRRDALTKDSNMQCVPSSEEDDYDFLKEGRKQNEERQQKALTRVKSMYHSEEGQAQYRRLLDYRKPEVESLAELFGVSESLEWRLPQHHHPDSPFHFVNLPNEEAALNIANRSILVKGIYELWGEGSNYEELEEAIMRYPDDRKLPYLTSESTFKITVDSFGKVISFQEQNERMKGLAYIPFKGRVNLKNPEHKFWLMETDDYGANNGLPPIVQRRIFFGREVGGADRKLLPTYQLKSRTYLGPTAMDAEIAFLMANQALVSPGKLIYDPFVGTGSILIAAAHFGAMTMGADIDIRVVRDGRGPDCNVWSNFKQYGLPMPIGLLRADNNLPPWRPGLKEVFDAIICDPPYGVRAGGRKSGGRKLLKGAVGPYTVPDDKRTDHIPSTAPYSLAECMHDLLDLAARMLVKGGRLVCFYPVLREDDTIQIQFPEHQCFKLVASSEQILSSRYRDQITADDSKAFKELKPKYRGAISSSVQ